MTEKEPFPLIDLEQLGNCLTENELQSIGKVIVESFQKTGYIYLKNHGLTLGDVKSFISASTEFFNLSEDFKMKYKLCNKGYHGYSRETLENHDENISVQDTAVRETFFVVGPHEPHPDQEVPELKITSKNIHDKMIPTSLKLLQCLELGLGMNKGCLVDIHQEMMQEGNPSALKSIRYMPPKKDEHIHRLGEHTDISTLTFQLHGDLEGLELFDNDGVWRESQLYPGYILLFPGEYFERITGGIIKAANHRVVIPKSEEMKKRPRHAVIFFILPDYVMTITPFNGRTDLFQPVSSEDYFETRMRVYYKGVHEN